MTEEQQSRPKRRVLVVEDDALLGLDMAQQLTEVGFDVLGPAGSVERAFDLIRVNNCDVAVLDVKLGTHTAEPVAVELRTRGTPFVVLSGYSRDQHPAGFHGAPTLSKPARFDQLVSILRKCVSDI